MLQHYRSDHLNTFDITLVLDLDQTWDSTPASLLLLLIKQLVNKHIQRNQTG